MNCGDLAHVGIDCRQSIDKRLARPLGINFGRQVHFRQRFDARPEFRIGEWLLTWDFIERTLDTYAPDEEAAIVLDSINPLEQNVAAAAAAVCCLCCATSALEINSVTTSAHTPNAKLRLLRITRFMDTPRLF